MGSRWNIKVDYLETNEAVVTFTISEGPKGHIQKIVFKGNKKIKSSDLKKADDDQTEEYPFHHHQDRDSR